MSPFEKETFVQRILFDFGHVAGISDARNLTKKMGLRQGPETIAIGAVHYSYSG